MDVGLSCVGFVVGFDFETEAPKWDTCTFVRPPVCCVGTKSPGPMFKGVKYSVFSR